MDKNIFDVITGYGINEAVNDTLLQNDEYKRIQAEIDGLTDELDGMDLTEEQRLLIDRLISAYNENGALYGRMTYQQGIRDGASLLVEMGLIKDAKQNLIDIMDDIESAWNEESGKHKFIVPIKITHNTYEECREIIINTVDAETAMHIAIGDFQHNGWIVDKNFKNYKRLKG